MSWPLPVPVPTVGRWELPGAALARRYLVSELNAGRGPAAARRGRTGASLRFLSGVEDLGSSLRAGGHKRFGSDQVRALAFSETGESRGELFLRPATASGFPRMPDSNTTAMPATR